jgi:hypothetical protein
MARKPNPSTEKLSKQVVFVLRPSLFAEFEKKTQADSKSVSQAMRELVQKFVQETE